VDNAERERAAAPDEVPLGEWTALRVKPNLTSHSLTTQLQLTNSVSTTGQVSCMSLPDLLATCLQNLRIFACTAVPLLMQDTAFNKTVVAFT